MIEYLLIGLLLLFLTFTLAMLLFQNRLVFPTHLVARSGPLPRGSERLMLDTPDGHRLHGVLIPPSHPQGDDRLLVVGFAGNAWNSDDAATYLHEVYPQAHIVAFHYRGYAPSTGSPTAKALLDDAPLLFDAAVARVQPKRTVALGFSIGSAVAASLAGRRDVDGIILVTPFDSLKAVAGSHYPWLPIGTFFREELNAAASLSGSDVPVAILAGERDTLIPKARTDALRAAAGNLVFDRTIASATHNDIYTRSEFQHVMDEALEAVLR